MSRSEVVLQPAGLEHLRPLALVRWAILTGLAACVLFLACHYALNFLLFSVDKEPARVHLRHAFESGELGIQNSLKLSSTLGVHQTNDCLIFDMASRDASDRLMYTFAAPLSSVRPTSGRCESLRSSLFAEPMVSIREGWYLRYLHGYRPVAIGLLRFFEVHTARQIMKVSSYGIFVLLCAINLGLLLRRRARKIVDRGGNELAYIGLGACFMALFGLPYFGQSISHAPAIVTLGTFLIVWSVFDYRRLLTLRRCALLVIVYALFTAYYEYLTGYIPVAVTLICLLVAIGSQPSKGFRDLASRLVLLQGLFAGCIGAVLALNLLFTAAFSGRGNVLGGFLKALLFRMSDERASALHEAAQAVAEPHLRFVEVLDAVASRLPHLGMPDRLTGMALIALALGILLVGLVEAWLSSHSRDAKWRTTLIAGSVIPLVIWLLAFANHTYIHASFMVRIVVSVFAAAVVMLAWLQRNSGPASLPQGTASRLGPPTAMREISVYR